MKFAILFSLVAAGLSAQTWPGNIIPIDRIGSTLSPNLRTYLELTQEQVTSIDRLNNAFAQFQLEKARRSAQVQSELAQETTKSTPDAMALGLRYVELESIRRETDAERQKTMEGVQAVLTAPQKTRIAALQEVLRTYSLACEAVSANLLVEPWRAVAQFVRDPVPVSGFASFLLGSSACPAVPTRVIRTGDFVGNPQLP